MSTQAAGGVRKPTAAQLDALSGWRTDALDAMPYMASMLFSLQPVDAPGLGTFAVDDKHRLYIDFGAIEADPGTWTTQMCAEALLHECGHLFGGHRARATDAAIPQHMASDWNISADAEINDDLEEAGCKALASFGVVPRKLNMPDHLTAEEYFEALQARRQKRQQQGNRPQAGGQGNGQQGQQPGDGDGVPFKGCGSGSGGPGAPCEMGDDDGAGSTGESFAPGATEAERRRVEIATAASIRDHASKGRGTVPGGLVARSEQVLAPPKIPWRQVLASAVKRAVARKAGDFDADPTKRSRRRHDARLSDGRRVFYPGTYTPLPSIAVVRDTSGSMGADELNAVTSEVDGIARQVGVRGRDLRVLDVDADVHEVREYTSAKVLEKVSGRGGTDMCVGIDAAAVLRPKPAVIVVISDGYTPWPTERTSIPLVICLVGSGASGVAADTPEWATTVVVDD